MITVQILRTKGVSCSMRKCIYLLALAVSAVCGLGLRLWNLTAGVDAQGLAVADHISVWLLIAASVLFLLIFLVLSICAPGRSGAADVLQYGNGLAAISYAAALLLIISAGWKFGKELSDGSSFVSPLILLLGLLSGFCLIGITTLRGNSCKPVPPAELIPDLYLLLKLVFDFRNWSTDPMILDYFPRLFGLIFVVMAFYQSTGFAFSTGKPRRTMFYSMAAIFFSAVSMADGITGGNIVSILEAVGFCLWLLPIIICLLRPRKPDPKTQPAPSEPDVS